MRRQNALAKPERCLARLQRLIPRPESRFVSRHTEKLGEEFLEIELEFSIRGAWMEEGSITILVTLDSLKPHQTDITREMLTGLISATINEELGWLRGVTWRASVDHGSLKTIMRAEQKRMYWHEITRPITRGRLSADEAAEVLAELLVDLRPELADMLAGETGEASNDLIRIEGRGLPCPMCLGHLGEDAIYSLYHRMRSSVMFDDDEE